MRIFLSYASEDRDVARAIQLALRAQGHRVFFDREDLPPGEEYDNRIRQAIQQADLFVFLVSAESLDRGSYTLTELAIAEKSLKHPSGRVLPVLLRAVPVGDIPVLLKSVTWLESEGNVTAAVADAVHRISAARRRVRLVRAAIGIAIASTAAAGAWVLRSRSDDAATMAHVPAGVFTFGDDERAPRREVHVDAFYLDRHEVTIAQYAKFLAATGAVRAPEGWQDLDLAKDGELPVVGVDWHDASDYCRWAGKRLPTEAEWEKAARGADERRYPWGDVPPDASHANHRHGTSADERARLRPVGAHPAGRSPFGIDDLAGNAAEWVADWYSESFATRDRRNPKGPESGAGKVIRGGGWLDPAERIGATWRAHADPRTRADDVGFRCARDAQ